MYLKCEVVLQASFMHKQSGKILDIDKRIITEYDEHSEEYKELCEQYELESGMKREQNKDKFDKELLCVLLNKSKETCKKTMEKLELAFKESCRRDALGYIEFGGWVLNVRDFSGVFFKELKTNISKH